MKFKSFLKMSALLVLLQLNSPLEASLKDAIPVIHPVPHSIGLDVMHHHMTFKEGMGRGHFKSKHVPLSHMHLHLKLFEHMGLEFAYSETKDSRKITHLNAGDDALGTKISTSEGHKFSYKTRGVSISSRFDIPLEIAYPLFHRMPFIFATAGVVNHRFKVKDHIFMDNGVLQENPLERNFSKRKTVLKLTGGLRMDINKYFGIRTLFVFENTNKIKKIKPTENPGSPLCAAPRNTVSYGMGIYFNL